MKILLVVLGTALCAVYVASAEEIPRGEPKVAQEVHDRWGEDVSGWKVGVAVSKTVFGVSEPIMVRVTTLNASDHARNCVPYDFELSLGGTWDISAFDLDFGTDVSYTRYGRWMYGLEKTSRSPRHGSVRIDKVPPGGLVTDLVWLNEVCDMTVPAKYRVTINRVLWAEDAGMVTVKGPPLEVQVGGGEASADWAAQVLVLDCRHIRAEFAAQAIGRSMKQLGEDLQEAAIDHPESLGGKAAGVQLQEVRKALDKLADEKPRQGEAGADGKAPEAPSAGPKATAPKENGAGERAPGEAAAL